MSAFHPKADLRRGYCDVRFGPLTDILRRGKNWRYSIISSARASTVAGTIVAQPRRIASARREGLARLRADKAWPSLSI
jgi:hypothetical protein